MKTSQIVGLIVLGFFAFVTMILGLTALSTYNNYHTNVQALDALGSEIDNQYQRRSDLVNQLVATVQGEANFEKSTLTEVISARARANSIQLTPEALKDPEAMKQFSQRQGDFTNALSKLMMLTENYPNLKANAAFRDLRAELAGTENRIALARNRYINGVRTMNSAIVTFPSNIFANAFGLQLRPQLQFEDAAANKVAPKIDFK